jgi:prepilin-type processing-associated H-X9-DG protein
VGPQERPGPFSYGYNNWGTLDWADPQLGLGSMSDYVREAGDPDWGPLPAQRVKRPASMLAIGDSRTDLSWDAFIDSNQPSEYPFDRHLDQANLLFADAHAESMYTVDMIDFDNTNPVARRRWNNDSRPH